MILLYNKLSPFNSYIEILWPKYPSGRCLDIHLRACQKKLFKKLFEKNIHKIIFLKNTRLLLSKNERTLQKKTTHKQQTTNAAFNLRDHQWYNN